MSQPIHVPGMTPCIPSPERMAQEIMRLRGIIQTVARDLAQPTRGRSREVIEQARNRLLLDGDAADYLSYALVQNSVDEFTMNAKQVWLTVGPFSVKVTRPNDGLSVRVFAAGREDQDELETIYLHDTATTEDTNA